MKYEIQCQSVELSIANHVDHCSPSLPDLVMGSMFAQGPLPASLKQPASHQLDFVHVDGRYRVGKLLGTGGSDVSHFNQGRLVILNSLASVFQGKDIMTRTDVTLKIGCVGTSSSKLSYEYKVYRTISGSAGISKVL
jgi:hypothetical protein